MCFSHLEQFAPVLQVLVFLGFFCNFCRAEVASSSLLSHCAGFMFDLKLMCREDSVTWPHRVTRASPCSPKRLSSSWSCIIIEPLERFHILSTKNKIKCIFGVGWWWLCNIPTQRSFRGVDCSFSQTDQFMACVADFLQSRSGISFSSVPLCCWWW